MKMTKARALALPLVLVSAAVIVASGACSQHEPGPYEGGGRNIPTSVIGDIGGGEIDSGSTVPDTSIPDVTPPKDNSVPDIFTGQ